MEDGLVDVVDVVDMILADDEERCEVDYSAFLFFHKSVNCCPNRTNYNAT